MSVEDCSCCKTHKLTKEVLKDRPYKKGDYCGICNHNFNPEDCEGEKEMKDKFPTIVKGNIDTWNCITYGYIIAGMIAHHPEIPYGEQMTRANNLTNLLFNALRKKMGVKTPSIFKKW